MESRLVVPVRGLNVGFGHVFHRELAQRVKEYGVQELRFDVLQSGEQGPDDLMPLDIVRETLHVCQEEGLTALCLLSGKLRVHRMSREKCVQRRDEIEALGFPVSLFDWEVGSEGNDPSWPYAPADLADMVNAVREGTARKVAALFSNNTGKNGLAYTRKCIDAGARFSALGIHPYRTTMQPEQGCPDGWPNDRGEEWRQIETIRAAYCAKHQLEEPFELWATEVGWHSRPSFKKIWLRKIKVAHFSEENKAQLYPREMAILAQHGVKRVHWFQHRNGPDTDQFHEAGYGAEDEHGGWLPLAYAMRDYAAEQTNEGHER